MESHNLNNIYEALGIRPIINAIGSVTMLGGSTPTREVKVAMDQADSSYVPLYELEEKAGALIAKFVNVPAAYITSGAGSALTLATAAIMAGDNDDFIQQLPNTKNMKSEILIQKRQRYWYDRCLELAGATLIEFGSTENTSKKDLEQAIGPNTAAVHFVAMEQFPDENILQLKDIVSIAHKHDIPVTVDAAGQVYPLENFGKFIRMGADFQCIALKYIRAPQSTGLALGTEDMIKKISYQSFVGYETRRIRGIGRPHKIDRQEMIGGLTAVQQWFSINHEERLAIAEKQSLTILDNLLGLPGVRVHTIDNIIGHQPFGVHFEVDAAVTGKTVHQVVDELKQGDPPIWTRVRDGEHHILIHVFGLNPGEEDIVGRRLVQVLS